MSRRFPSSIEGGGSSFTVLIGGVRFQNFQIYNKKYFEEKAIAAIQSHLKTDQDPVYAYCKILPRALPQYTLGHLKRVAEIRQCCPKNFVVSGNFMDGVGISDIVKNSKEMAIKLTQIKSHKASDKLRPLLPIHTSRPATTNASL